MKNKITLDSNSAFMTALKKEQTTTRVFKIVMFNDLVCFKVLFIEQKNSNGRKKLKQKTLTTNKRFKQ